MHQNELTITNLDNEINQQNNSEADNNSDITDGRMCRYCYCEVLDDDNYSSCTCMTALCRKCMERELCLTEGRQDHTMKCTVCMTVYDIQYMNHETLSCIDKTLFAIKETICCSNLQIQGRRIPTIRERVALILLMFFLSLWTWATTYSILDPGVTSFSGFSTELLVYLFLVFMDWCVGFSMIWFVKLVDTLQLTLPFSLGMLHVSRCIFVIYLRFFIFGIEDGWKLAGSCGLLCTSLCVIASCVRLYIITLRGGYRRLQMRNFEIMVGGKGPFRLKDIDRNYASNNNQIENNNQPQPQDIEQQLQRLPNQEIEMARISNNDLNAPDVDIPLR